MKPEIKELLASLDHTGSGDGHPNTLCRRSASVIRELVDTRPFWVIETARGTYWDGRKAGDGAFFTAKIDDAARFYDFGTAEIVRCWLLEKESGAPKLRSTEHGYLPKAA